MDAKDMTFGVELEINLPRTEAVTVGGYHQGAQVAWLPEGWKAQGDGSIRSRGPRYGVEIVSPVLQGAAGMSQIVEVLKVLRERGATVNGSCGFHVHVGWSGDASAQDRLVTLVANFEKAIYASTGTAARERGRWCRGVSGYGNAQAARDAARGQRYHVLNLTNLATGRQPTVEFRAFAGTLNADKVVGYVFMCLGLVERAIKASRATNFAAKAPVESSPIHRGGEGQTALTRLFYQLGWTKGRARQVYGWVEAVGVPSAIKVKRTLMKMARKYDRPRGQR